MLIFKKDFCCNLFYIYNILSDNIKNYQIMEWIMDDEIIETNDIVQEKLVKGVHTAPIKQNISISERCESNLVELSDTRLASPVPGCKMRAKSDYDWTLSSQLRSTIIASIKKKPGSIIFNKKRIKSYKNNDEKYVEKLKDVIFVKDDGPIIF